MDPIDHIRLRVQKKEEKRTSSFVQRGRRKRLAGVHHLFHDVRPDLLLSKYDPRPEVLVKTCDDLRPPLRGCARGAGVQNLRDGVAISDAGNLLSTGQRIAGLLRE